VTLSPSRPASPADASSRSPADSDASDRLEQLLDGASPEGHPSQFDFPASAPAANPVFYRTYSRRRPHGRESWSDVAERSLRGLRRLGQLNDEEVALLHRMQLEQ
jgi:ribonucleotide reductase class II